MGVLIIYHSEHHLNTEKVAKAMGEAVNAVVSKADDFKLDDIKQLLNQYEIVGLGSGIYSGKHHKSILDIAANLPKDCNSIFFIFSTSGVDALSRGYHNALKNVLISRGVKIIGEFNCLGFDTALISSGINKGRPDKNDLQEAKNFIIKLIRENSNV